MGKPTIVSVIPDVPITELRPPPPVEKLHDALYEAGQPRANRAPTIEKPEGTPDRSESRQAWCVRVVMCAWQGSMHT